MNNKARRRKNQAYLIKVLKIVILPFTVDLKV